MTPPVVFQYQRALDEFRREGREPPLLKRMSELISLLDLTTTLDSGLSSAEILDAALLIVMGELQASRGALLVRAEGGRYEVRAARGMVAAEPLELPPEVLAPGAVLLRSQGLCPGVFAGLGLEVLCPIHRSGQAIALLGLGARAAGRGYGEEEAGFLRSVAACAATPIENGLIYHELKLLNQKLSLKVFQLRNLFEISRELTASLDEEAIQSLVVSTLMGQLMVSRCALYLRSPAGLALAHARGARGESEWAASVADAEGALAGLRSAAAVGELPAGALRERLQEARMALVVPLAREARLEGFLAAGERPSSAPFSEEDRDFAFTLGRQAMAALESVRLHRIRVEKERQDRELEIARGIQQGLFPAACPRVAGFEVAALSRPCQHVGGDYYDFIPLGGGRIALAVADVSGKGTPASILMASVHASLRALSGTAPPPALMERVNAFLYESTQPNKYVTLFYAELDPSTRRLVYVNAGHVPPYRIGPDGRVERLTSGGPVLGLLDSVCFEAGEVSLAPGDTVAVVTDGATEALSPQEVEFGDERVARALRRAAGASAEACVSGLQDAVSSWTGPAGCSDDFTVLVLKAR